MKNPLTSDRIARDGGAWANETIATAAWRKAASDPDAVAIYLEDEPHITYGAGQLARRMGLLPEDLDPFPGDPDGLPRKYGSENYHPDDPRA